MEQMISGKHGRPELPNLPGHLRWAKDAQDRPRIQRKAGAAASMDLGGTS